MRRAQAKRELMALGYRQWKPSDAQRDQVRIHHMNGVPEWRICQHIGCTIEELRYHFWRELNLGKDEMIAWASERMFRLARQEAEPSVAFQATKLILQTRSKHWRVPTTDKDHDDHEKPIAALTMAEMEVEIAKLLERRRAAAGSATSEPEEAEGSG